MTQRIDLPRMVVPGTMLLAGGDNPCRGRCCEPGMMLLAGIPALIHDPDMLQLPDGYRLPGESHDPGGKTRPHSPYR